jgi:hypothetical protein
MNEIAFFDDERHALHTLRGELMAVISREFIADDEAELLAEALNFERSWPGLLGSFMAAAGTVELALLEDAA